MLVMPPALRVFFLALAITSTLLLSPEDHVMHPDPPCSDVPISNKNKKVESKLQRRCGDPTVVV